MKSHTPTLRPPLALALAALLVAACQNTSPPAQAQQPGALKHKCRRWRHGVPRSGRSESAANATLWRKTA